MFSTWGNTQEVGWVRHAFDKFEVPFDLHLQGARPAGRPARRLRRHRHPEPGSRQRQGPRVRRRVEGQADSRTRRADSFKTLGVYGESDDITGGMGLEGVVELQKFVNEGGVLITLGRLELLPAGVRPRTRNVNAQRPSSQFYAPGPIVEAEILQADAPDLLWLSRQDDPGAVRQRSAAPGAAGRRGAGPDAVSRRRRRLC